MSKTEISIILPVYNEEQNISILIPMLKESLDKTGRSYEVLVIDDHSKDNSLEVAKKMAEKDNNIKIISFRRNFGQTAAIAAGMKHSTGNIIIPMDADLQNDPKDLPILLEKIDEGYDVVSGWRKNRHDAFINRKLPSWIANRLIASITGVPIKDFGCTFKAYTRDTIKHVNLYGEMHRFIPAYASWSGAKIIEVPVTHHARKYGKSNYGINRTLKVVIDLITVKFLGDFSNKPSHIFGTLGLLSIGAGFLTAIAMIVIRFQLGLTMNRTPLPVLSALFVLLGFQFIMMGLLAEINIRTYHESQDKPTYIIKEKVNLGED